MSEKQECICDWHMRMRDPNPDCRANHDDNPSPRPPTREQIAEVLWLNDVGTPFDSANDIDTQHYRELADAVLALFPQPTPSALPHFCTPGCTNENCSVKPLTDAEAAELRAVLSDRGLASPAAPPSIADMVPGTSFVARTRDGVLSSLDRFWMVAENGWVFSTEAHHLNADRIDPSTIRDVTPPKDATS